MSISIVNSGTKLATNVTGLNIFTEYAFQVLAFTSIGDGPKSSVKFEKTSEDGKRLGGKIVLVKVTFIHIERFSIEYRKTKTKVITFTNHRTRR